MKKISVMLIVIAVVFLAVGIFRTEAQMVLQKGIKLCLECVGIG